MSLPGTVIMKLGLGDVRKDARCKPPSAINLDDLMHDARHSAVYSDKVVLHAHGQNYVLKDKQL